MPAHRKPKVPCSVEDCGRSAAALGYCPKHYHRVQRWGDPRGQIVSCGQCSATWVHETKGGRPHGLCVDCRQSHAICTICKSVKPHSEFYPERTIPGKVSSRCRGCAAEFSRTRNAVPATKEQAERNRLKHRYGITPEQRAEMEAEQGSRCAICRLEVKLVVDHCHETKAVRELLCGQCNSGLGMFMDSTELMATAISYLKKHRRVT